MKVEALGPLNCTGVGPLNYKVKDVTRAIISN